MRPVLLKGNNPTRVEPTVVIVDDDHNVRTMLERLVVQMGCLAHTAANADEALALLVEVNADVVLCDIRMPGHGGDWLIERILQRWPHLPIVIVSGVAELDPHLTLRTGVAGYILKPFDLDDLRAVVTRAMERPPSALPDV